MRCARPTIVTNIPARVSDYWRRTSHCCRLRGRLWRLVAEAGRPGRVLSALALTCQMLWESRRFDAAVVASTTSGNLFAVAQSLLPFRHIPTVMIDCLWYLPHNPILRLLKKLQHHLASRSVTRFVVWASHEVEDYARAFCIPESKLQFLPFHTTLKGYSYTVSNRAYVFSGGNGDRDYATLIRAVRGLSIPVVIATANMKALKDEPVPGNVRVQSCSHAQFRRLMAGSAIVVVPMEGGHLHSGGQQTYLNAMAMGKPVVVCGARGARDYIAHRYDGILLDHGDVDGLRRAIAELVERPGWAAAVGRRAQRRILAGPYGTDDCMRSVAELAFRASERRLRLGRTTQCAAAQSMEQTAEARCVETTGLPRRG